MTNDMTVGSPAKLITKFTVPFLIGNLFQQLYNIADTVIVGRTLGTDALAAVGATGAIVWFAFSIVIGASGGMSAVTAQRFGAGDKQGVKRSFGMSILISAVITLVLTLVYTLSARGILALMHTPQDIAQASYSYIIWIFAGMGANALFNLLSSMIRALGDSKTPLIFLIAACIINIILDLVLILKFNMGTGGAGLATASAQLISGLMCIIYIVKKLPELHLSVRDIVPDGAMIKTILRISVPMSFLTMVLSVSVIVMQYVNNLLGTVYVATYAAASKLEQFMTLPVMSFGSAISVYAAQNYGASKPDRIKSGVNFTLAATVMWSVIFTVIIFFCGKAAMYAIAGGEDVQIINDGYLYIIINSVCSVILSPLVVYKSTLQSLGRTTAPLVSGFAEVICRAVAALYLARAFGFIGICVASPLAWLGALIIIGADYIIFMRKMLSKNGD